VSFRAKGFPRRRSLSNAQSNQSQNHLPEPNPHIQKLLTSYTTLSAKPQSQLHSVTASGDHIRRQRHLEGFSQRKRSKTCQRDHKLLSQGRGFPII